MRPLVRRTIVLPLLLFFCTALSLPALALERPFPANAKRGKMSSAPFPQVVIDGKLRRLSPGIQVRNQNNLIEMPSGLRVDGAPVNYVENDLGEIHRIWLLSPTEAEKPAPKQ